MRGLKTFKICLDLNKSPIEFLIKIRKHPWQLKVRQLPRVAFYFENYFCRDEFMVRLIICLLAYFFERLHTVPRRSYSKRPSSM